MENSERIDLSILAGIAEQLTELNRNLTEGAAGLVYERPKGQSSFLFEFDLNGSASGEDYTKYFNCLETITSTVNDFGIHIGNNGYAYIIDALKIIIDRETYDVRLKTDIYPLIAARYRMNNQAAVEHSIRNAISVAYDDHLRNPECNKMGVFSKRPTNKQFLIVAADTVIRSMYEFKMRTAS